MMMSKVMSMVAVVAVLAVLMSSSLASAETQLPPNTPPCAAKFVNCTLNMNMTQVVDDAIKDPNATMQCCTYFQDLVNDDKECVCNTWVFPPGVSQFAPTLFDSCQVATTPDALCKGVSNTGLGSGSGSDSGNGSGSKPNGVERIASVGLFSSVVLLIGAMVM